MAALPAARLAKLIKAAVKDEYGIYFQKGNKIEVSIKVPKFNKDFASVTTLNLHPAKSVLKCMHEKYKQRNSKVRTSFAQT